MAKVLRDWPPNIDAIRKVLPVTEKNIFAYDGVIYCAGNDKLYPEIHAHEEVHFEQQRNHPGGAEGWWKDFLEDPRFRLEQEIPAHQAEYQHLLRNAPHRNARRYIKKKGLKALAQRLAAPMYGKIISVPHAMRLIAQGT